MKAPNRHRRVAIFLLCCLGWVVLSSPMGHASQNQRAPDFALQGANGKGHSLASYAGKSLLTTPTFWLIDAEGRRKEFFRGVKGVDLLTAVLERKSTSPVTDLVELLAAPQRFTGEEQTVTGILRRGQKPTRYYLTNTKNRFYVNPWLPEKSIKGNLLRRDKPGMDAPIAKPMFLT